MADQPQQTRSQQQQQPPPQQGQFPQPQGFMPGAQYGTQVPVFKPEPPDQKIIDQQNRNAEAQRLLIAEKILAWSLPGGPGRAKLAEEEVPAPNPDWYNSYSGFGPVEKGLGHELVQTRIDEDKSWQKADQLGRIELLKDVSEKLEDLEKGIKQQQKDAESHDHEKEHGESAKKKE
jgi:hypothetical protein